MALIPLLALLACGGPGPAVDSAVPEAAAELISLSDAALLRRLSLDLRGTLPTLEELDAIEADPAALDTFRTELLDDPRLEDRVVALLAERWHTRVDVFDIEYGDYGFSAAEEFAFERSVGEEPLRLAAKVVVEDRPWSEVVTADATVANELLAEIWPLDYPAGESGWQWAPYTDGRPAHLLSPSQLSTALADLSGFEWTWKGFDQLDNDDIGYRVLGGGVDGASVYSPQTSPGLTLALVFQRAAEAAASTLVQRDLVEGSHLLLQGVELDTDPEDPAFTQLLTDLGRRLTGQRPSEEELAAQIALFEALDAGGDREEAWTGLLSALLRDPEFLVY